MNAVDMRCPWKELEPPGPDGMRRLVCEQCGGTTNPTRSELYMVGGCRLPPERRQEGLRIILPGFALQKVIGQFFVREEGDETCLMCNEHVAEMNGWSIEECKKKRRRIRKWLLESATKLTFKQLSNSIARIKTRTWFRAWKPFGCIAEEAIRIAEASRNPAPIPQQP